MFIMVYDYRGKQVGKFTADDITMQLNLSDNANGVYLVRIINENGAFVDQKKVIIAN